MISPETYYEEYLKGKTPEEILKAIRSLKREITRLKNIAEHPDYVCELHPSESVRISCSQDYLERAKLALKESGVGYQPTKSELKAIEFDANIPNISKIIFSIGGFLRGEELVEVTITDDTAELKYGRSYISTTPDDFDKIETIDKASFLEEFKRLHIGEWSKNYNTKRFGYTVLDGTQWELEIHYSNDKKIVKIYGYNAYPYKFDRLKDLMMCDDSEKE
jgi:hypothetical protein